MSLLPLYKLKFSELTTWPSSGWIMPEENSPPSFISGIAKASKKGYFRDTKDLYKNQCQFLILIHFQMLSETTGRESSLRESN